MKRMAIWSVVGLVVVGAARAQEGDAPSQGDEKGRVTRVLVLTDPDALAFRAAVAKALGGEKVGALAVAPPLAPDASKTGLAFSGASTREVAHFHLGLSIFMGLGLAIAGQERDLRTVMDAVVQVLETLAFEEDILAKARALARKGTDARPEDFQALAAAINEAVSAPRESMAYGLGLASGTLILAMGTEDPSMVRQAHVFLKTLIKMADEVGIENPMVALGRDLVRLSAKDPVPVAAIQSAFEKRLEELGLKGL